MRRNIAQVLGSTGPPVAELVRTKKGKAMPTSLKQAIATALDRKYVPTFKSGDVGDLGLHLGLASPFSCLDLLKKLEGLPALQVLFATGTLSPSSVTGWAQLAAASDGSCSFRTHVHEGGLVGHNYSIGMVLPDVKDANGNALAFVQTGSVAGSLDIGSSDDDQDQDGFSQLVVDHWDVVKKNARYSYDLKVSTDPLQVVETALIGALVGAAAVGIAAFVGNPNTHCEWSSSIGPDDRGQPEVGSGVTWRQ
jgi:hypothetical protein